MIGYNNLGYDYYVMNWKPYVMISVSVTDPLKCGGKLGAFQFCVKASVPNQPIEKVITYYSK